VKNVLTIEHQLTQIPITFCYNEKTYKKYLKKEFNLKNQYIQFGAVCTEIEHKTTHKWALVIGIKENKDIYVYKALLVHELSHAVTKLMLYSNIDDDEYRSYTLQWLYLEIIPFLDNLLKDK